MKKLSIEELNRMDVAAYKRAEKIPVIIVLDNVRSMNNIGSVFRTSDAYRIERICLCGITAVPPNKEIHKTALGATDAVAWNYFENTMDAIDEVKQLGYTICAIEQCDGSIQLGEFKPGGSGKYALVFGHEIRGVDQKVVDKSDYCIEIPQHGTKHSLNISVSVGIVVWEFFRNSFSGKV